jgi:hypothetical protein
MHSLAAIRTARQPPVIAERAGMRCHDVEDLNWPAFLPVPDKKTPRRTEMWVPGPNGQWQGTVPTLQ